MEKEGRSHSSRALDLKSKWVTLPPDHWPQLLHCPRPSHWEAGRCQVCGVFGEPSPHDPPTLVLCPGARHPPPGLPPWEQPRLCLPRTLFKNAIIAGPETSALPLPMWQLWEGHLCPPGLTDAFPGTGVCSQGCGTGPQRAPRKVRAEIDRWLGSGFGRPQGGQRVGPG